MTRRRLWLSGLMAAIVLAATLPGRSDDTARGRAAAADHAAVEAVALRAMEAMKRSDFETFVACMSADALKRFRSMIEPLVRRAAADTPQQQARVLELFKDAGSIDAVLKLSDARFMQRFLEAAMGDDIRVAMRTMEVMVIGTLFESKDLGHVTYRMTMKMDDIEISSVAVLTCRRESQGWALELTREISNLGAQVREQLR